MTLPQNVYPLTGRFWGIVELGIRYGRYFGAPVLRHEPAHAAGVVPGPEVVITGFCISFFAGETGSRKLYAGCMCGGGRHRYRVAGTAGPPGLGGRCGSDSCQLCASSEDGSARRGPHSQAANGKQVSAIMDAERRAAGSAPVTHSQAQAGRDSHASQEWVAALGAESRRPKAFPVMERSGALLPRVRSEGEFSVRRMGVVCGGSA
jgi:hypothetical protein